MISKILRTTTNLPDRIQAICWVQFWAWIGAELRFDFEFLLMLICTRLVPFPLLQQHMGRRSLLPLLSPRIRLGIQ